MTRERPSESMTPSEAEAQWQRFIKENPEMFRARRLRQRAVIAVSILIGIALGLVLHVLLP